MSAARTAYPSTVERAKPGSACGAVTGAAGTRCRARSSGTGSAGVRRAGRKPASASATVRVVKNSRPASAFDRDSPATRQPQDAHHRAERDLPETADRGPAHDLLELADALVHVAGPAAGREMIGRGSGAPWSTRPGTARTCRRTRRGRSAARWWRRRAGRCPRPSRPARRSRAWTRPRAASRSRAARRAGPGPRKLDEAPPGWMAPSARPPDTPPASSSSSRAVVPIGTQ